MKKIISLVVSLGILTLIYWKIDFRGIVGVFAACDPLWMALSLLMVVPLTAITAWRFQIMMPPDTSLGFGESNKLILASSVLNMVLPSKMGDIAKAYFLRDRGHLSGTRALSIVVFEKAGDMLSLLAWCALGLVVYPDKNGLFWTMTAAVWGGLIFGLLMLFWPKFSETFFVAAEKYAPKKIGAKLGKFHATWAEIRDYFWNSPALLTRISVISVFLWFLHLVQIWLFCLALRTDVPLLSNLALAPLAILAGLLPLTFAGVGTRDGALIYFFGAYMNAHAGAALGLLCTSRYLLPALGGLPFLAAYTAQLGEMKKAEPAE